MLTATLKLKACQQCKREFMPARPLQAVCGAICASRKVRADKKAERITTRARKEAIKTRSEWIRECQAVVNRYCRLRDIAAGHGCITCGAQFRSTYGGAFDAGHWRSVGSAPQLRFFTAQIRLQCVRCNRDGSGRAVEFRIALVKQRGEAWVQMVESMNHTAKFDIHYLKRLKAIASRKVRRLEKRMEQA